MKYGLLPKNLKLNWSMKGSCWGTYIDYWDQMIHPFQMYKLGVWDDIYAFPVISVSISPHYYTSIIIWRICAQQNCEPKQCSGVLSRLTAGLIYLASGSYRHWHMSSIESGLGWYWLESLSWLILSDKPYDHCFSAVLCGLCLIDIETNYFLIIQKGEIDCQWNYWVDPWEAE